MAKRKKSSFGRLIEGVALFALIFSLCFLGFQFFTKTGIFRIPGVVYYDESLTAEEVKTLKAIFTEENTLDKDVTISATDYLEKPELKTGEYIYQITVPVTDYYSTENNLEIGNAMNLLADPYISEINYELIDINSLNYDKKLLSINGKYYLDDFNAGAVFRVISFESENFKNEIEPLIEAEFNKTFPTESSVLTFAQTGVTALSRGMDTKLGQVDDATYFAANIKDYLSSFDLTHTSNESSFSEYAGDNNICSSPKFLATLQAIGLDIVELTGNHNQDCGNAAASETIDIYHQNNIKTVGGGKNAEEAAKPLQISEKDSNITFLAYNLSTGGATHGNTPGANQYYEENAISEIKSAKERGDFIVIDIQYYECSAYASEYEDDTCDYADSSAGDQIGFFRHLIDLGANMVVGTSAHQPQTYELYGDGVIYYGLGNLFFDQCWWPGTTRSLILSHYFYNGKLLQTKIAPTYYDQNFQTSLMKKEEAKWFIERLTSARP
ncbi:CapA family protein [Candidatus Saccharibacteria bacterium]|nr:CapA family protein [Candidatus Saccharibacteria bacterium]